MALDAGTVNIKINAQTGDTKQRIDEVKNSLDSLGNSSKLVSTAMNLFKGIVADKALDTLGSAISKIGPAFVAASRDINSTGAAAQNQLAAVSSTASEIVSKIPLIGGFASGVIDAYTQIQQADMKRIDEYKTYLQKSVDAVAAYGDDILTKSATTGLNTDTVQVFEILQGITDVDFETLSAGMKTFKTAVVGAGEGDEGILGAFQKLGVSLTNPDGSDKSMDTLLKETIAAFQSMSETLTESEKWALATELFGQRGAQALMPLLDNSELSYENLEQIAADVGILNESELELSGILSDMNELKTASESAKDEINGLRTAIVELDTLNKEIEANKAKKGYEEAGINPETGEVYTAQDVAESRVNEGKSKRAKDRLLTKVSGQEVVFEDIETQASAMSFEEAAEYVAEKLADIGEQNFNMLLPDEQDLRDAKQVYEYYKQNEDLFDPDKTNSVLYKVLGFLESEELSRLWQTSTTGFSQEELSSYSNLLWDFIDGTQIASPDFINKLEEEFGNRKMPTSTSAQKQLANDVWEFLTSSYSTTFYGGSLDELYNAAHPQTPPDGITGPATGEPPIIYEAPVNGDNSGNTNSFNETTNNYYNVDFSTGDMN